MSEKLERPTRRAGAGYSIPAAAEEIGVSERTMRAAVKAEQVRVIKFGGLRRVPTAEVARLKALFGQAVGDPASPAGGPQ